MTYQYSYLKQKKCLLIHIGKMKVLILTIFVSLASLLCRTDALLIDQIQSKQITSSNEIGRPCSTNISNAWLNIVLIIETSSAMGASNLRQQMELRSGKVVPRRVDPHSRTDLRVIGPISYPGQILEIIMSSMADPQSQSRSTTPRINSEPRLNLKQLQTRDDILFPVLIPDPSRSIRCSPEPIPEPPQGSFPLTKSDPLVPNPIPSPRADPSLQQRAPHHSINKSSHKPNTKTQGRSQGLRADLPPHRRALPFIAEKLSLSLSSELSQLPVASLTQNKTRVGIVTYSDQATLVADFSQINSNADVAKTLMSLQVSNSSSAAGIVDAIGFANEIMGICDNEEGCTLFGGNNVFVIIGASMK
uniref:VWFA domain-containing protein n=1 Tax=Acrobeloides nanus TaxID=290746 RepID=A0A914CR27_9BILA